MAGFDKPVQKFIDSIDTLITILLFSSIFLGVVVYASEPATGLLHEEDQFYKNGVQFIQVLSRDDVPESFDVRDLGGEYPPIKNQGSCGSCWSFSLIAAMEIQIGILDKISPNLAEQTMVSNCCTGCGSCYGGYMSAGDFLVKHGAAPEELDPYLMKNSGCKFGNLDNFKEKISHKLDSFPYVGSSLWYSRRAREPRAPSVDDIKAAMYKFQANASVTIAAIGQSPSTPVITSCSAINSGGNHMQNVVGWETSAQGYTVAKVRNSHGLGHGHDGHTVMRWDCGAPTRLNRGLGRQARIPVYKPDCPPADAWIGQAVYPASAGTFLVLGRKSERSQKCNWQPKDGIVQQLSDDGCQVLVQAQDYSVEYHLTAIELECGTQASAMTLVEVDGSDPNLLKTPLSN